MNGGKLKNIFEMSVVDVPSVNTQGNSLVEMNLHHWTGLKSEFYIALTLKVPIMTAADVKF